MKKISLIIISILIIIIIILINININNNNKIYKLEQNNKAFIENNINNKNIIYEQNIKIEELERLKPQLENKIDSLNKLIKKGTIEKIDIVEVFNTDSIFVPFPIEKTLDTVINEKCMDIFLACDKDGISLVIEQKGEIYLFHTQEKELVNPSNKKFVNFLKRIFGKKRYYDKIRVVDDCGILKDVETYNIYE